MTNPDTLAGPNRPPPPVSDIDAASFEDEQDLVREIIESLRISGGCVVRNFIEKQDVQKLGRDFAPHFAKAKALISRDNSGKGCGFSIKSDYS